jgi:hypothetical protein
VKANVVSTGFLISENCIMRSFRMHFYLGHHTKEDEMVRACSTHGCRRKTLRELEERHSIHMVLGRSRYRWAIILK